MRSRRRTWTSVPIGRPCPTPAPLSGGKSRTWRRRSCSWLRRTIASPAVPSCQFTDEANARCGPRHYGELLPRWDGVTRGRTQEPRHRARSDDGMLLGVSLVVLLDVLEIVKIIVHQSVRLLYRSFRRVGEEVQPLDP